MKKGMVFLTGVLAAVFLLNACAAPGNGGQQAEEGTVPAPQAQKISAEEAHTRMESGDELVILDVRTAEEYETAHIPGAILLPNEEIGEDRPAQLPVLDTEILIYCRSGNRSAQAAKKLQAMGYTKLYDFGGINDWPYETESGAWEAEETEGTLTSFTSYDLSGVKKNAEIFSEHTLTMVNVWGTYCPSCLREMPDLGILAKTYADQGVQIVGLVVDVPQSADGSFQQSQVEAVREITAQTGADYLHLLPSADLISAKLQKLRSVPTTFFVDADGKQIGDDIVGPRSAEEWSTLLNLALLEVEA